MPDTEEVTLMSPGPDPGSLVKSTTSHSLNLFICKMGRRGTHSASEHYCLRRPLSTETRLQRRTSSISSMWKARQEFLSPFCGLPGPTGTLSLSPVVLGPRQGLLLTDGLVLEGLKNGEPMEPEDLSLSFYCSTCKVSYPTELSSKDINSLALPRVRCEY